MKKYIVSFFILGCMIADVYGDPCVGLNSGFKKHETDCTKYYSCVNGVGHLMTCPAVYPIFRQDTQMCDSGNPAECVQCPATGIKRFPVADSCTKFILCVNGVQSHQECQNGLVFDANIQQCNLAANAPPCVSIKCPAVDDPARPTFIRHPTNCAAYFICVAGSPLEQTCPAGTVFNPNNNVCDLPANVVCPVSLRSQVNPFFPVSYRSQKAGGKCAGNKGILNIPDPEDCSRYYMCMNDQSFSAPCATGLIFDTKTAKCGQPSASLCVRDISAQTTSPCAGNVGMKYKPNEHDCAKYYMCMSETEYPMTCPAGKLYDTVSNKCENSSVATCYQPQVIPNEDENPCLGIVGTKNVADPKDCSGYFLCVNDMGFPQRCASALVFDVVTNSCNRPEVSVCASQVQTPPLPGQTTTTTIVPQPPATTTTTKPATDLPIGEGTDKTDATTVPTAPTVVPPVTTPAPNPATTAAPTAPTPAPTTGPIPSAPTPSPTTPTFPTTTTTTPTFPPTTTTTPMITHWPTTTTIPVTTTTPAITPAPAPVTTPSPSAPFCTPGLVFYSPHPDCAKFYRCVYGQLFTIDCPANQYWNQAREYCDHMFNVNCVNRS